MDETANGTSGLFLTIVIHISNHILVYSVVIYADCPPRPTGFFYAEADKEVIENTAKAIFKIHGIPVSSTFTEERKTSTSPASISTSHPLALRVETETDPTVASTSSHQRP